MNSNHEVYQQAEREIVKIFRSFDSITSVIRIIDHLNGFGMLSDKVSLDILKEAIHHNTRYRHEFASQVVKSNKTAIINMIEKCGGLFCYISQEEKKECIAEIERLAKDSLWIS